MPLLTINAPGIYPIMSDYTAASPTDDAVRILPAVHHVTILLYSRLVGAAGPASLNSGIFFEGNAAVNVIGMGGSIRGFQYGVRGEKANIARVRDVFVQDAYFRGICISGQEPVISDNDVWNVGGCTAYPNAYCMGIETQGLGGSAGRAKILRNTVQDVYGVGTGEGVAISLSDKGDLATIQGNTLQNAVLRPRTFGLWVGGDSDPSATHNHFEGFQYGAAVSSVPDGFLDGNTWRRCTQKMLISGTGTVIGPEDLID